MLSFDVKVKENVTGGARSTHFSSRGAMDDMNAAHMPPQGGLYIDTSIPPRGTGPDAIYPKVSPFIYPARGMVFDDEYLFSRW